MQFAHNTTLRHTSMTIAIPAPVQAVFTTFPLQTFPAVPARDTALEAELCRRTFAFGKHASSNDAAPFTLVAAHRPVSVALDGATVQLCSAPAELFVQLCLCHKNALALPREAQEGCAATRSPHKVLVAARAGAPELLLNGRLVARDELLRGLAARLPGVHRQLAQLLDRDLAPLFAGRYVSLGVVRRATQTLRQFEQLAQGGDSSPYLEMKVASYVLVLLHVVAEGEAAGVRECREFVQGECPALVEGAYTVLRRLSGK